jgi:3-phenylpropionate/cinnamic acid dioxygenase small subunit
MTDLQALADRLDITDVLMRYATAMDTRDYVLLRSCFTDDATLEYDLATSSPAEFVERVTPLARFEATQHMVTNVRIELDGDHARTTSYAHAMHVRGESAGRETYLMAGTYTDEFVRDIAGWRICRRRFVCSWAQTGTDIMTPTHEWLRAAFTS